MGVSPSTATSRRLAAAVAGESRARSSTRPAPVVRRVRSSGRSGSRSPRRAGLHARGLAASSTCPSQHSRASRCGRHAETFGPAPASTRHRPPAPGHRSACSRPPARSSRSAAHMAARWETSRIRRLGADRGAHPRRRRHRRPARLDLRTDRRHRSMGMYTAPSRRRPLARPVRRRRRGDGPVGIPCARAGRSSAARRPAREWLEAARGRRPLDQARLAPKILERRIRFLLRDALTDRGVEPRFCGVKAQRSFGPDKFATMDLAEAFPERPLRLGRDKETTVCAAEADMDGALTMQILKSLSSACLFADVGRPCRPRYLGSMQFRAACASFAARSDDPLENLRHVNLYPEDFYFPAGGASIRRLAVPGTSPLPLDTARPRYRMHVLRGGLEQVDSETTSGRMQASTYIWPHTFGRFESTPDEFLGRLRLDRSTPCRGPFAALARSDDCSTSTSTGSAGSE